MWMSIMQADQAQLSVAQNKITQTCLLQGSFGKQICHASCDLLIKLFIQMVSKRMSLLYMLIVVHQYLKFRLSSEITIKAKRIYGIILYHESRTTNIAPYTPIPIMLDTSGIILWSYTYHNSLGRVSPIGISLTTPIRQPLRKARPKA